MASTEDTRGKAEASTPLKVLVVEDSENDALLLLRALKQQGFAPEHEVVETPEALAAALERGPWDIVLSDYSLPRFSGPEALALVQQRGLDLPFIVISGTVGEAAAIETMRGGAHDYLMKGKLGRLGEAIRRELEAARARRERQQSIAHIEHLNRVLRAIRNVNQLIVRERDPERLIAEACELLIETRGYGGAWILHENGAQASLAGAGWNDAFPTFAARVAEGWRPPCATRAAAEGLATLSPATDCRACPLWREYGHSDAACAALRHGERYFGALGVAVSRKLVHSPEEQSLLTEIAGDLAFALFDIDNERHRAESERRFEVITESSADAIFISDTRGNYLYVNRAACELLGYTKAELTAMSIADVSVPEQTADNTANFRQLLAEGRQVAEIELVRKDGAVLPADLNAVVLPDGRIYGSCRDISQRKALEAQLAQADRLASMGMLAAGVAHEINNPLSYVLFNLESLDEDLPQLLDALQRCLARHELDSGAADPILLDDVRGRFADALAGTRRIRNIARGLGTFSRVEQDRLVEVNLRHVIEAAINMAYNELKYRARLVKDYGKVPPVLASEGRLSQVFLNLIINAAHAIDEGDVENNEIRIRTWAEGEEVCAEVRDTGKGIAPEHMKRLFDPFFTTKGAGVGSGLGLAISKNIVESYGGSIAVTSELGRGTSFALRLPLRREQAPTDTGPQPPAVEVACTGRILIVDDEPGIRKAMTRLLRGHETVEAASGAEAKELLAADRAFDLVLCDVMMPDVSGMDLHRWLSENEPRLARQFIFITGGAFTPRARDYLAQVDNIRLEKPFDATNFRKIVAELLQNARREGDD